MLNISKETFATEFAVGDGATFTGYSDCHAATIIKVSASGKTITLQQDEATLLNGPNSGEEDALVMTPGGFAGHTEGRQRYSYKPDPNGRIVKATLREWIGEERDEETLEYGEVRKSRWKMVGNKTNARGGNVLAKRMEFYDYNF